MMFVVKVLLPFLYIPIGIVLPIYGLNTDYGWSVVIGFWIPIVLLGFSVLPGVDKMMRKAFFITIILFIPITVLFEYVCLLLDIWNFSEEYSKLWGLNILGAPIEEFIFWFGATPLCLLVYLYYKMLFKEKV